MKTKLSKILGVGLALLLVFGMAFALVPNDTNVEANPTGTTPNQWEAANQPGGILVTYNLDYADVADYAVANDGATIYAINNNLTSASGVAAPGRIYKSPNNGRLWSVLPNPLTATSPRLIAVAPDNPMCIAIVDNTAATAANVGGRVWISNDGGANWSMLVAIADGSASGSAIITDIAIGPARAGTLLGRDYVVTIADTVAAQLQGGDVAYVGFTTAWTSCTVPTAALGGTAILDLNADNVANDFDFTSVTLSPGFVGDRTVAVVGSDNVGGGTAESAGSPGDAYLFLITLTDVTATLVVAAPTVVTPPGNVRLDTTLTDSPADYGFVADCIVKSDVVVPKDFSPAIATWMRSYVSWASVSGTAVNFDDVYRVDFMTVRKLESGTTTGIWSIALNGTISAGGTLVAGEYTNTLGAPQYVGVYYCTDPNSSLPSWSPCAKPPTGSGNCTVAIDAADPLLCYAGTCGTESAFSVSGNGALTFNQRSLINTAIDGIQDVAVTPDGKYVFMATWDDNTAYAGGLDTTSASNYESLWMSPVPTTSYSWERICISPLTTWGNTAGDSIVRLSPYYNDPDAPDGTIFWIDRGAATARGIQRSIDGGDIFSGSLAPAGPGDVAVESKDIIYLSDIAADRFFRSTTGGWGFDVPVVTGGGIISNLQMCPSYPEKPVAGNLIAGFTAAGAVMLTMAGGATGSWIPLSPFPAPNAASTAVYVLGDYDYANNSTVYCASNLAGTGIWRYKFGSSTVWENICAVTATTVMTGLAMDCSALYGSWTDTTAGATASAGDAFTLVTSAGAAGGDNVTIQVTVGSLTVTSSTLGTGSTITGTLTAGNTYWASFLNTGDWITLTAATINTTGVWSDNAANVSGTITTDLDGDATVWAGSAAGAGPFSLPDIGVAGGAGAVTNSGAVRSLVPTVPVIAAWLFETMGVGATGTAAAGVTFNVPPSAVKIAASEVSNCVWTIDTTSVRLMAYDDDMSKAKVDVTVPATVTFDPSTGMNNAFVISWNLISNAVGYDVGIFTDPDCTQLAWAPMNQTGFTTQNTPTAATVAAGTAIGPVVVTGEGASGAYIVPPQPLSPAVNVPANVLASGRDYYIRVFIRNQSPGDAIVSPFLPSACNIAEFTVEAGAPIQTPGAGPVLQGPQPGAVDVDADNVVFSWSSVVGATEYEFILATDATLQTKVAEGLVTEPSYGPVTLDYGTSYFYAVKVTKPSVGPQSVASFTTAGVPSEQYTCQYCGLTFDTRAELEAHIAAVHAPTTPLYIWIVIAIGAILVIAVIWLIFSTRRA